MNTVSGFSSEKSQVPSRISQAPDRVSELVFNNLLQEQNQKTDKVKPSKQKIEQDILSKFNLTGEPLIGEVKCSNPMKGNICIKSRPGESNFGSEIDTKLIQLDPKNLMLCEEGDRIEFIIVDKEIIKILSRSDVTEEGIAIISRRMESLEEKAEKAKERAQYSFQEYSETMDRDCFFSFDLDLGSRFGDLKDYIKEHGENNIPGLNSKKLEELKIIKLLKAFDKIKDYTSKGNRYDIQQYLDYFKNYKNEYLNILGITNEEFDQQLDELVKKNRDGFFAMANKGKIQSINIHKNIIMIENDIYRSLTIEAQDFDLQNIECKEGDVVNFVINEDDPIESIQMIISNGNILNVKIKKKV